MDKAILFDEVRIDMIVLAIIGLFLLMGLFTFAMCKAAARGDNQLEEFYRTREDVNIKE